MSVRVKFATHLDPALLCTVRDLAEREGRQVQSLMEEALANLVATRARVVAPHEASLRSFAAIYGGG
jgi:predicted transcriptional regulator